MSTQILKTPEADIAYDVHGPLPAVGGRPPLVMIGQPMDAAGFRAPASHFPDRTVITYDPRGLSRSVREDGRVDHAPETQAADVDARAGELLPGADVGARLLESVAVAAVLGVVGQAPLDAGMRGCGDAGMRGGCGGAGVPLAAK
ncbi:hypothetical protein [Spirillospora sp. NPDC048819]|uniref:alpha/beta fold hydrolase n=1 Tax=Spirillospora sp. NPDC048819 TaxID=3155268 RepID=UPI0033C59A68